MNKCACVDHEAAHAHSFISLTTCFGRLQINVYTSAMAEDYHGRRPSSVRLASVKHDIYHPLLPTLRRMDMDDVARRLPDEHSRTTTPCTREMFENARSTLRTPKPKLHCKGTLNRQTDTAVKTYQPLTASTSFTESWNATMEVLNKTAFPQVPQTDITGLLMRAKQPAITGAWQYSGGLKPLPANMYSRHRSMRRPFSAYPWKY